MIRPPHVFAAAGALAALGIAYVATRSAGPVGLTQYTELREGPLQEHLVSAAELAEQPVYVPHSYPSRVGHGVSACISHGFAPLWQAPDPQAAALPSEAMW